MEALSPRLDAAPRAGPLAVIVALHAAIAGAALLLPPMRERLALPATVFVRYLEAARERPPEPLVPRLRPHLRDPLRVEVPMPPIALAPEVTVAPAPHAAATITGAMSTPKTPTEPTAPAPAPVEPPRFDMAYLRNPAPAYPAISRRMREEGRVLLRVLVSAAGAAEDVELRASSGSERLDRAAMDAVRRWRFAPARRGVDAVAAWALVPIVFQLDA